MTIIVSFAFALFNASDVNGGSSDPLSTLPRDVTVHGLADANQYSIFGPDSEDDKRSDSVERGGNHVCHKEAFANQRHGPKIHVAPAHQPLPDRAENHYS